MNRNTKPTLSRRTFMKAAAVATGAAGLPMGISRAAESSATASAAGRSLTPKMVLGGRAAVSRPMLDASQLSFRIGLARTRTASYPLDSMDFIMMDLERPDGRTRHAHWCVGDLSGRLLEFLSCAEGVDGQHDPRLDGLFERILKQRRPSGIIGRYAPTPANTSPEDDPLQVACAGRLFPALIRYFELTGDARAIEAASGLAERLWSVRDAWRNMLNGCAGHRIEAWVTEPFARLYGITKDPRWLDFCGMVRDSLGTCESFCHAHGLMSTLRGLQIAAMVTGENSWNEKPEQNRRLIIDRRLEMSDGCTPESLPHRDLNEGCSIADWLMLNLNAGLINGDDTAYEKAERIFWNALAFNQFVTGSFGSRRLAAGGYSATGLEEAWWCCVHNGGMAMSDYARHVVTFRDGAIRVNFLIPGRFEVPLPEGNWAVVTIATTYPTHAEATIEVEKLPAGRPVKVRVPGCVRRPEVKEVRTGEQLRVTLRGELGHRIERCGPGVILTYGPLVLVPATWPWGAAAQQGLGETAVSLPAGVPAIKLNKAADADGFVELPSCPGERPLPEWSYFDEGPGVPTWVEGAAVEVNLKFSEGDVRPARFTPMCYNTSNLSLFDTPIMFRGVE